MRLERPNLRLLIDKITKDPILKMYDGKKDLKIVTDASLHAVAATLMQKKADNKLSGTRWS